jgi:hypothetical protein
LFSSCGGEDAAAKFATSVNVAATEMLNAHASERIVTFHPDTTAAEYTLRLEKHFPCSSNPCDAPGGQKQGVLRLKAGLESTGVLERWVSVPEQFEVTRKGQDTDVILTNKGWYAEVRSVY